VKDFLLIAASRRSLVTECVKHYGKETCTCAILSANDEQPLNALSPYDVWALAEAVNTKEVGNMRSTKRTAVLVATALVLVLVLTTFVAWAQSADGPYFVVDPSVAAGTTHVFQNINNALNTLNGLGQEAWGATLVLLPGDYQVASTIVITIPYLRIVTRDGEDKARIIGEITGAVISIQARGVTLQDLKLIRTTDPTTTITTGAGISVAASDVTLRGVLITGFDGNGLVATGDRLSVTGCSFSNNGGQGNQGNAPFNGVALTNCADAVITDCDIRSNTANGVNVLNSNNVQIVACRISNNPGGGITIVRSSYAQVTDNKEIRANGGPAIQLGNSGYCEISGNGLIGNASGILMTNCVGCTVQENKSENSAGPAVSLTGGTGNLITKNHLYGVENPPVASATILLAGNATTNTVSENVLTKNTWGIVLNNLGPDAPSGNVISSNEISNTTQAGIYVRRSDGNNVIQKNSISDSVQFGLWIQNGTSEKLADNVIQRSASDGVRVTNEIGNVTNCLVTNNLIDKSGGTGISIDTSDGAGSAIISRLTVSRNAISDGASAGILVTDVAACQRPSIKFNKISGNDGSGIIINGTANASLWRNIIHDNEKVGLVIAELGGPASARQNTIYANQRGGVQFGSGNVLVLEENSIFLNLGYALHVTGVSGSSFAKNWWGSATGPAGVFSGIGNAVLGVPNEKNIEPILCAPALASLADDAAQILGLADAQVSFINSFTAGRVVVDRTDTAGLKLVFTEVSVRNNALVATVPFTSDALKGKAFSGIGDVLAASGVLVSGIQDGMVSIGFEYGSEVNVTDGTLLTLYVYQGGQWKLDDSGTWGLQNGKWNAVPNCHFGDTNQVLGDVPVESLTGEIKAIALVLEKPESQ